MRKLKIALALMLTLLLAGCSAFSFDGSDIMCPPKATGNKAQIQKLIDKQTKGDYTLKYPKNGANRSSIVMQDIDNDSEEEAVAFYADDDNSVIHALFVESEDGDFSIISDIVLEANNIDRIDFADLNGDKTYEILIGCSSSTSSKNTLCVYDYNETITQLDVTTTYSSLVTGDFNFDKADDILLISLFSNDISAHAKLLIHTKGSLTEISTAELDSDITSLACVQYGQISYGVYGAVIDGITSTGDYTTQVVLFDSSRPALLNPLYTYSGYNSTRRSIQICSTDFDKDELIDVPVCSLMPYSENEDISTVSRKVDWSNFDTTSYTLKTNVSSILCPKDGYSLTMPEKWNGVVTARYNEKSRETTVSGYKYVGNTFKLTDGIISIKAYSDEDFDKNSSGYIEFLRSGSTVYAYALGKADNYLSITGDELKTLFTLVNQ